jgi:hypothetical protein
MPRWPASPIRRARTYHEASRVINNDNLLTTHSLTAYYIAFGPHGPRRPPPPDEGRNVFFLSAGVICAAFAIFAFTRMFASPIRPRTMTKEWQEASEEYLKVCGIIHSLCDMITNSHSPKEPSPSPATRACWSSPSPRRTFLVERRSTTSKEFNHRYHSIHQHRYLISLGQHFAWYRLCARHPENGEDKEANVIFTPQCTEFRGFCAFHSGDSHLDLVCASTLYAIMPLSINALST